MADNETSETAEINPATLARDAFIHAAFGETAAALQHASRGDGYAHKADLLAGEIEVGAPRYSEIRGLRERAAAAYEEGAKAMRRAANDYAAASFAPYKDE